MIKHFTIKELVPKHIIDGYGEEGAWKLLDEKALKTLEWLRENLGPCTINNWHLGGSFSQSGLRTWQFFMQDGKTTEEDAKAEYDKSGSQHKYGRAFDGKFKNHTAEEVRKWIKENWSKSGFDWSITLEEGVSWLHFDVRPRTKSKKVYSFKP